MTRTEQYAKPGALPTVSPSTIKEDLRRRDFTINAMAASITARDFGRIVDPLKGREDIDAKMVRIIHDESFIDDATRILRAIRYTTRYDFRLDPHTARLLRENAPKIKTISGDRIRHEFIRTLEEYAPEKALLLGHQQGALREIHPGLLGDGWLEANFKRARLLGEGRPAVYLALLCFRLDTYDVETISKSLKLPTVLAKPLQQVLEIKQSADALNKADIKASKIFELLHGFSEDALATARTAYADTQIGQNIEQYMENLQNVVTGLDGKDLLRLGVTEGPDVGTVLNILKLARLDNLVKDKYAETAMVKAWLAHRADVQAQRDDNG